MFRGHARGAQRSTAMHRLARLSVDRAPLGGVQHRLWGRRTSPGRDLQWCRAVLQDAALPPTYARALPGLQRLPLECDSLVCLLEQLWQRDPEEVSALQGRRALRVHERSRRPTGRGGVP